MSADILYMLYIWSDVSIEHQLCNNSSPVLWSGHRVNPGGSGFEGQGSSLGWTIAKAPPGVNQRLTQAIVRDSHHYRGQRNTEEARNCG
ncbi:hypothetical protein NQZ68_019866 [Dissostichus eleginoides]|nr:hypothetical protein NQZ68_019866 [Dissostichus eleginoides]